MITNWDGLASDVKILKTLHGITIGRYTLAYDSDNASLTISGFTSSANAFFNIAVPSLVQATFGGVISSNYTRGMLFTSQPVAFDTNSSNGGILSNAAATTSRDTSDPTRLVIRSIGGARTAPIRWSTIYVQDQINTLSHIAVFIGDGTPRWDPSSYQGAKAFVDGAGIVTDYESYPITPPGYSVFPSLPTGYAETFVRKLDTSISYPLYDLSIDYSSRYATNFTSINSLNTSVTSANARIAALEARLISLDSDNRALKTKTAPLSVNQYGTMTMRVGQSSITMSPGGIQVGVAGNPAFPAFGSGSVLGISASNINFQSQNAIVSGNVNVTGTMDIGRNITRGGATIL